MNRTKLEGAGIDYGGGLRRFSGNAELYEKFLRMFICDKSFEQLEGAVKERDMDAAFSYAHTLKGVTGNLSLNVLYDSLVPLVEDLRSNNGKNARALLENVRENYCAVIKAVDG